jgi:membrane associated rhomboid family serine protease
MSADTILSRIRPVLVLIIAIWVIEIINFALQHRLNIWFGLEPRTFSGLIGIPAMPLLHGSIGHAAANTLPLIFLGGLGLLVAPRRFAKASFAIVFVSGLAVWLMARDGIVVGASGLIFGWFGFLLALGAIERSPRAIIGAIIVIIFYGGMVWGLFPKTGVRVSWEAHMFGAATGAIVAYMLRLRRA